jgi:hypothetical protein
LRVDEGDEPHFKLITALVLLGFPHSTVGINGSETEFRVSWWVECARYREWGAGVEMCCDIIVMKCDGLHIVGQECSDINCVRGGVSGDLNDVWSNTVMMEENCTLKRILNSNFKEKRNVGRTYNDL